MKDLFGASQTAPEGSDLRDMILIARFALLRWQVACKSDNASEMQKVDLHCSTLFNPLQHADVKAQSSFSDFHLLAADGGVIPTFAY